jgi:hypothetical protein
MEKGKTIKMNDSLHKELKDYCKKNCLKINDWVNMIVKEKLEDIKNNSNNK